MEKGHKEKISIACECMDIWRLPQGSKTPLLAAGALIDANDNTPVLDIKPHTPSFGRVETPGVPVWCNEWPRSTEASGCFYWEQVFNF